MIRCMNANSMHDGEKADGEHLKDLFKEFRSVLNEHALLPFAQSRFAAHLAEFQPLIEATKAVAGGAANGLAWSDNLTDESTWKMCKQACIEVLQPALHPETGLGIPAKHKELKVAKAALDPLHKKYKDGLNESLETEYNDLVKETDSAQLKAEITVVEGILFEILEDASLKPATKKKKIDSKADAWAKKKITFEHLHPCLKRQAELAGGE